jgi:serine/threonine protein kinase
MTVPHYGIILEFCEKGSLKNYLKNNKNLNIETKINFALDISKGLKF